MTDVPTAPVANTTQSLMKQGVMLVDVRGTQERAREYIPGSLHIPLETFEVAGLPSSLPEGAIFHCRSGNCTQLNAALISASLHGQCPEDALYLLEGGLDAWKRAGFGVQADPFPAH